MLRNAVALFRGTVLTFATAPGGLTIQEAARPAGCLTALRSLSERSATWF